MLNTLWAVKYPLIVMVVRVLHGKISKIPLRSLPSKPRMPIPTSALLRPNVTGKPTKECLLSLVSLLSFGNLVSVWIYLCKSQPGPYSTLCCKESLHYPSHMIILQSFAPSPWLQQNTEKCGGSKNALVYKPSGRWPAWWPSPPAETVSVKQPYQMSKQIWHMLYKKTLCSELFQMSLTAGFIFFPVHGLFDKPHNRTLLLRGNSAANDLVISTRMSQLLWCGQDVKFVNTCWLWKTWCFPFFKT